MSHHFSAWVLQYMDICHILNKQNKRYTIICLSYFLMSWPDVAPLRPLSAELTSAIKSKWMKGVSAGYSGALAIRLESLIALDAWEERPCLVPWASASSGWWSESDVKVSLLPPWYGTTRAISVGILIVEVPIPNPLAINARRIHGERTVAKWNCPMEKI